MDKAKLDITPKMKLDNKPDTLFDFYRTPMGKVVRQLLSRRLQSVLPVQPTSSHDSWLTAGIGYARPYMNLLSRSSGHQIMLQLSGYTMRSWPKGKASKLAEVDETNLPLLPSMLDHVLMVHGLEATNRPDDLLDETWRLLKGGGKFTLVVPYRRGIWASQEHTPFGHGQPFSQRQLRDILALHGFSVHRISSALILPPVTSAIYTRLAPIVERLPHAFGGVLVVAAEKQVYSARPVAHKSWRLKPRAVPDMANPTTRDLTRDIARDIARDIEGKT